MTLGQTVNVSKSKQQKKDFKNDKCAGGPLLSFYRHEAVLAVEICDSHAINGDDGATFASNDDDYTFSRETIAGNDVSILSETENLLWKLPELCAT